MKRMHVHVGVKDLEASIAFYSELFAAQPAVQKPDYAKWLLDDPRLNFAITQGHTDRGIEHLGIETDSSDELAEVYSRLERTESEVLEEGHTTCCYAKSEKSWIADPDGVLWETFHTSGEETVYGAHPKDKGLPASARPSNVCCPG
ncbi:ArsI/CadI family heavy metal resistance metalloenzyme [Erythrobacter alti]|uniref:ArsI/CadI family heavy metal resistance metalloenzyme n=1 Tax=Erythrobacter alti TaxID=1896145 RepID=UPI0030F3CA44